MSEPGQDGQVRGGVGTSSAEVVVAVLIFALGALVVYDSRRLGAGWGDDGPQSGYFPFHTGLLLCIASTAILVQAAARRAIQGELFVTWDRLKLVMTVLVPAAIYVLAVQFVGIYIASAVYIAFFMVWLGRYAWFRSVMVGVIANAAFFLMFEVWFKVPLYKGVFDPLAFLGY